MLASSALNIFRVSSADTHITSITTKYDEAMTILGPLADEPVEPMTKEQFERVRKRLRESWDGTVTLDKRTVETLINEVLWLKRRLHRVEHALEPIVDALRQ